MDCSPRSDAPLPHCNGRNGEFQEINLSLKTFTWRYRGEGNANLVIALPREKVIVRMQKCDYNATLDPIAVQEWEVKLKKSVVFYKTVMVPLLGTEFIIPPDLARITEEEIADIDRMLLEIRPDFRLSKGIRLGLVTVQPDYTLLPPRNLYKSLGHAREAPMYLSQNNDEYRTFCVEIKPKQGWVPPNDRQHSKCTFCMKQYLKLQKRRTTRKSKYCPLDLFSGVRSRMRRALEGLLDTPQNNLKIFLDGNIIYGEGLGTELSEVLNLFFDTENSTNIKAAIDRWCLLVLDALTREFDNRDDYHTPNIFSHNNSLSMHNEKCVLLSAHSTTSMNRSSVEQISETCDWSHASLPPRCILQKVLSIQKLQKSDFKSVYTLYKEQSEMRGNYSYVDELFSLNNTLDEIQRYLLSATAKDCSIFIALQKTGNRFNENSLVQIKDSEGVTYRLNIGISDIDPKPLSCIGKHFKRNEEFISVTQSNIC